jgi:transposase
MVLDLTEDQTRARVQLLQRRNRHRYRLSGPCRKFFCKLEQSRAIVTRHDKTARNFLAAVHLAAAAIWLN